MGIFFVLPKGISCVFSSLHAYRLTMSVLSNSKLDARDVERQGKITGASSFEKVTYDPTFDFTIG
jgi:hypothetical protein